MAYDRKYGKVTTEFGNIGEDEPVVVFRAQDALLPKVLSHYILFCLKAGSPKRHIDIIFNTMINIKNWQGLNLEKVKTLQVKAVKKDYQNDRRNQTTN